MAGLRGVLEVAEAAGKGMVKRAQQWAGGRVPVSSLRVDQGPRSLPEAKALGPEVFSVASYREKTGEDAPPPPAIPPGPTNDTSCQASGAGQSALPSPLQHPNPGSKELLAGPAIEMTGEGVLAVTARG